MSGAANVIELAEVRAERAAIRAADGIASAEEIRLPAEVARMRAPPIADRDPRSRARRRGPWLVTPTRLA